MMRMRAVIRRGIPRTKWSPSGFLLAFPYDVIRKKLNPSLDIENQA